MSHDMLTVKSIPIRCLIEVRSEEKACSLSTGSVPPETEIGRASCRERV